MNPKGAEGAASGAASDYGNGVPHRVPGRNLIGAGRVGSAGERQGVHSVHFAGGQRKCRGLHNQSSRVRPLKKPRGIPWVLILLHHPCHSHESFWRGGNLLMRGKLQVSWQRANLRSEPACSPDSSRMPAIPKSFGNFHHGILRHSIDQQVSLGVEQKALPNPVAPEIVVGHPSGGGPQPAQHHWNPLHHHLYDVGVLHGGSVRPAAGQSPGAVCVIGSNPVHTGVVVNHAVHIARGDTHEKFRHTHFKKSAGVLPVRLGKNPHPVSLPFKHPGDHRHPEGWMIHIGVAADQKNIQPLPAQGLHLTSGYGKKTCGHVTLPVDEKPALKIPRRTPYFPI